MSDEFFDDTPETTDSETSGFEPTGFEPELGGVLREENERSGFEPELGGLFRQKGYYVEEKACIGCMHCTHIAPNTFYVEPNHGRARVFNQDGDSEEVIEEAVDTCPTNCIHSVDYTELSELERKRQFQIIKNLGFPQR